MNAHQLIEEQIAKIAKNANLVGLHDFLQRVYTGVNGDIKLNSRQRNYILTQISWYNTPGMPRIRPVDNTEATMDAHRRWLLCPNTVNSFVTAINSMTESAE